MVDLEIPRVIIAILLSAILTQSAKAIINSVKEKKYPHWNDLIVTGGMPSAHSAMVSGLLTILYLETGLSYFTAISLVLFTIVITDSLGVRRTAGEEGKVLNNIIKIEKLKISELHYALGHKPADVLVGILIGFVISFLVYLV